ncbi:MAG: TIGR03792 family protein [Prochlorococcus sp. ALOHA_A2.0_51]|nr:TIGR03792 family protein [Prochlorococcus sp. ALOHA_A2.0_51]
MNCRSLSRLISFVLSFLVMLSGHPDVAIAARHDPDGGDDVAVVEHLRIKVPAHAREAWLKAEQGSWEPWLAKQSGYLGRDIFWDAEQEEGILLIRWASREQWKSIPQAEVDVVQARFDQLASEATGQASGHPFLLQFEGELVPQ